MKVLFILLAVLTAGTVQAQSTKTTITENVKTVLARYGWQDRIKLGTASADGHQVSVQFVSADDENFVFDELKSNTKFKESDGIMLNLFHHGAQKSFRELNEPSMHIVRYENKIEIHFDLHCPGLKHPLESYEHFREIFMNWWHHSCTSQEKVASKLKNNLKVKNLSHKKIALHRTLFS
jgi:DNA polymerase I-like protein with 3'-5' exonuclease and polymerase domains